MRTGFLNNLRNALRQIRADKKGVSAIEFALIFPILIVLLAAATDLGQALMVYRKVNLIVGTAADLVSQESSWSTTQLDAILTGTSSIILPFDTDDLTVRVSIVDIDSSNNATVNWSRGYQISALSYGDDSPIEIPSDIVETDVQMVVATATYSLTTPFAKLMEAVTGTTTYEYSRFAISRPRTEDTITLE